jgi:hypothetical protein
MKSFLTHITEAKGGFKDFQDPWAMMNPEDRREAGRLQIAALKAFPGSPRQKEIRAKLNAILKKYRIGEDWSRKYERSIDCDNPKGFSQRAHCQGRKKKQEQMKESASDERWMRSVDSFLNAVKLSERYPKHDDVIKGKDVHFIVIDTGSVGDSSKGGAWRQSHEWHGFVADSDSPLAKITHFQSTWTATASRGNWGNPQLEMGRRQLMRDVWDRLAGKKVLWKKTMRIG